MLIGLFAYLAIAFVALYLIRRSMPRTDPQCPGCRRASEINAQNVGRLPCRPFEFCPTHGSAPIIRIRTGHHKR